MRILVIRLSSLGDIVLTQPILAELRNSYPEAEIVFLTKREFAPLPDMFGLDLRTAIYDKRLLWHLKLASESFDLVIDLHAKTSSWLVKTLVKGQQKASYDKQRRIRSSIVKGNRTLSVESTIRLYQSALDKIFPDAGRESSPLPFPRLELSNAKMVDLDLPQRDLEKKLAGVFVGAAHATKAYPAEQWTDLIRMAQETHEFWLLGSVAEQALADNVCDGIPGVYNLCGRFNIPSLARVIDRCDAIISGDTGPMHMGAALGRPQVVIYGGTHPRLGFRPLNSKAKILCADLDCQPCSLHGSERCPLGHLDCMRQIKPQQVYEALLNLA